MWWGVYAVAFSVAPFVARTFARTFVRTASPAIPPPPLFSLPKSFQVPNTEYTVTLYAKTRSAFDGSYAVSTGETTTFTTPENTNADDAVPYPDVSAPVLEQDSGVLSWTALDLTGLPVALSLVAYEVWPRWSGRGALMF